MDVRVYPRVCGGTAITWQEVLRLQGLSPRVRGNHVGAYPSDYPQGSIPACAGEPGTNPVEYSRWEVYPRVCGGTGQVVHGRHPMRGLSPRVRGNPRLRHRANRPEGSIPACAGEPAESSRQAHRRRVYPRVYGGTLDLHRRATRRQGLSPRVRGNRVGAPARGPPGGSIPACAGEPRRIPTRRSEHRVYPRVCGGTTGRAARVGKAWGLSPRVRGNRSGVGVSAVPVGSIPACAGEPCPAVGTWLTWEGLSPRVRGNPSRPGSPSVGSGSIPACAGEPRWNTCRCWQHKVYPRVCGGTDKCRWLGCEQTGLSPRVRGNQL